MVLVTIVVLLATAEAYAAFRRAQYHPATLLCLVAVPVADDRDVQQGCSRAAPGPGPAGRRHLRLVPGEGYRRPTPCRASSQPSSSSPGSACSDPSPCACSTRNLSPYRHGIVFLLAAVIVTVSDDVASPPGGLRHGSAPVGPPISPNKSWEGLIGGAMAAILVSAVVVHFIHPWTIGKAALYGIVVAVVAPIGDLSQSMVKRHLGMKDMGHLLPGHGGILDRFDGLLFVLPATYFVVKALHLG